jgi:hypothetical protein
MDRDYDIFEILPDESLLWRGSALGTENATSVLADIGKKTANECFAMNMSTMETLACVNVQPRRAKSTAG